MNNDRPDSQTETQLADFGYSNQSKRHTNPLLICDVDEVVLHLVDPFVEVLTERGYTLKSHSFKLTGNVYDANGREATQQEVWDGLAQLFNEQATRQTIVDGVVEGLTKISEDIDIVFLTNMPHEYGDIRREYLASNVLDFPLITNTGTKVPAMRTIFEQCDNAVGFIDDTPQNLKQVQEGIPDIKLFHFMANERFRHMIGTIDGVDFSEGDWEKTTPHIRDTLIENAATAC